jgi:hypothetical protein
VKKNPSSTASNATRANFGKSRSPVACEIVAPSQTPSSGAHPTTIAKGSAAQVVVATRRRRVSPLASRRSSEPRPRAAAGSESVGSATASRSASTVSGWTKGSWKKNEAESGASRSERIRFIANLKRPPKARACARYSGQTAPHTTPIRIGASAQARHGRAHRRHR